MCTLDTSVLLAYTLRMTVIILKQLTKSKFEVYGLPSWKAYLSIWLIQSYISHHLIGGLPSLSSSVPLLNLSLDNIAQSPEEPEK